MKPNDYQLGSFKLGNLTLHLQNRKRHSSLDDLDYCFYIQNQGKSLFNSYIALKEGKFLDAIINCLNENQDANCLINILKGHGLTADHLAHIICNEVKSNSNVKITTLSREINESPHKKLTFTYPAWQLTINYSTEKKQKIEKSQNNSQQTETQTAFELESEAFMQSIRCRI